MAGDVRELLCGVGSKFDLARVPRRKLLPLLPGAGQAGARTAQSGEVDGRALQRGLGRSNTAQRVLRQIDQPDGVASRPPVSGPASLGQFSWAALHWIRQNRAERNGLTVIIAAATHCGGTRCVLELHLISTGLRKAYSSIAAATPSSSFDSVSRQPSRFNSGTLLPITIGKPANSSMSRSL